MLKCDTVAQAVEKRMLTPRFQEWERAAEAKIASELSATNEAIKAFLINHGGVAGPVDAMLVIEYLGRKGSYYKPLKDTKARLTNAEKTKIYDLLRGKNTKIRERGEQRALRFQRGWKSKVNLAQVGFGETGRTAY
eukprot:COSAG01_NODE_11034_length_2023_cov_2.722973_2_plen_136_part_00